VELVFEQRERVPDLRGPGQSGAAKDCSIITMESSFFYLSRDHHIT
jgi:hypothetical protein